MVVFLRVEDHRHAVVQGAHQVVSFGRENRAGLHWPLVLGPRFPQAGERERLPVAHVDVEGLLGLGVSLLPLIEAVRCYQAALPAESMAERGLVGRSLRAGGYHAVTDFGILSPRRNQSPTDQCRLPI